MAEIKIRPSRTLAKLKLALAGLLAGAVTYLWLTKNQPYFVAGYLLPLFLIVTAAAEITRTRFIRMEVRGDRLQYEAGMTSKTSRSIPLHKVQDVTVNQTFWQRMFGYGNLSIETAGETSRLTMAQIEAPRVVAEQILDIVAKLNEAKK